MWHFKGDFLLLGCPREGVEKEGSCSPGRDGLSFLPGLPHWWVGWVLPCQPVGLGRFLSPKGVSLGLCTQAWPLIPHIETQMTAVIG